VSEVCVVVFNDAVLADRKTGLGRAVLALAMHESDIVRVAA